MKGRFEHLLPFVLSSFLLLVSFSAQSLVNSAVDITKIEVSITALNVATNCSMPCCAKQLEHHCTCGEAPAPTNNNVPISKNGNSKFNSLEFMVLNSRPKLIDSFSIKFNMVGWMTGLDRPAPPSVKLFVLNESFLC